MLNLDPKVKMDGQSAYSRRGAEPRRRCSILLRNSFEELRIPAAEFERERQAIIERNHALFGTRRGRPGPHLPDRPPPGAARPPAAAAGLQPLDVDFAYAAGLRERGPGLAASSRRHVVGQVQGGGDGGRDIAVAVNGRIAAVGDTFTLARATRASWCR